MSTPTETGAEPGPGLPGPGLPEPGLREPERQSGAAKKLKVALVAGLLLLVFDLSRAPNRQWTAWGLLLAIDAYQATFSKAMPALGVSCRFTPTCSRYTEEAIRLHGAWHGSRLGAWRILRCAPWTPEGTVEPPPETLP